jgi:hypothetical protein
MYGAFPFSKGSLVSETTLMRRSTVLSLPFTKSSLVSEATIMRRSAVLSLPLQKGFPVDHIAKHS